MALGSNRDYVKTWKTTAKRLREHFHIELWECPNCNRKQYPSEKQCPRCGTEKP